MPLILESWHYCQYPQYVFYLTRNSCSYDYQYEMMNYDQHQKLKHVTKNCSFFCSVFISMYSFNQDSSLNLTTSFNTNPSFKACFKFLMCITDSFLLCKLAASFRTFSIFILLGASCKSFWRSWDFLWALY